MYLLHGLVLFLLNKLTCVKNDHLMASFPGPDGLAGTTKAKPFWILMKQEIEG